MDHQQRQQQKQITQLQPSNLQIVKENISQEEVESPVLPLAMTTSHTKGVNVLHFDEILQEQGASDFGLPSLNILQLPNDFSPLTPNDVKQDEILESRSDFQIQEQQPNNFKNLSKLLGAADSKPVSKQRSLSGAIRTRTLSHACILSTTSAKKTFLNRKAKTNTKQTTKSDRTMLLGVRRAPSDLNQIIDKNWIASYVEIDLSSQHKRKRLNDDSFLKESVNGEKKPTNQAMIKAIDSDDAMDYLRVRKQKGVSKLNIKKANVFEKVIPQLEALEQQMEEQQHILNIQQMKQQDIFSDDSSIMGDKWYDNRKDNVDFKFEITSNVDSIEFPMNQNLNLKLNLKSLDGEQQIQQNNDIDFESPKSIKHQFQFTGEKVDLNLQIQNDNKLQQQEMPVKSDMKALQIQKFTLSNIKPFDQLLDADSSENEGNLQ